MIHKEDKISCSGEIMLFKKTKRGDLYRIAMGPTGAHRLVGARPVEHAVDLYFGSVKEKSNRSLRSKGLAPTCCLPPRGREGVTLAISMPAQKTRGISTDPNFQTLFYKNSVIPGSQVLCIAALPAFMNSTG